MKYITGSSRPFITYSILHSCHCCLNEFKNFWILELCISNYWNKRQIQSCIRAIQTIDMTAGEFWWKRVVKTKYCIYICFLHVARNLTSVIMARETRLAQHVERLWTRGFYRILAGKPGQLGYLVFRWRIILKRILEEWYIKLLSGLVQWRTFDST
jgi:hypothetical protein